MRLPGFIARRYLFSKKNTNAINIISSISVLIFTVGTAVMIVILSFLNGLESLVKDMNNSFDPDIKITAKYSKTFPGDSLSDVISDINGIEVISQTLEDNVVVRYGDAQEIARVKGVDENFIKVNRVDTLVVYGKYVLEQKNADFGIFGSYISSSLGINLSNDQTMATLFVPRKGVPYNSLNPEASLSTGYVMPSGVMVLNEDGDKDLILTSQRFVRELFEYNDGASALELKVKPEHLSEVHAAIKERLGEAFEVRDRSEQNESAYKVFKTEKWATFAILVLVVLIAAFNTIGALTMLVLEKKKDIHILKSMGASNGVIRRIFMTEGMLITWLGIIIGIVFGVGFVLLQQYKGIVPLEGSFVEYFPVKLLWGDILRVAGVISILGICASIYPSIKAVETI